MPQVTLTDDEKLSYQLDMQRWTKETDEEYQLRTQPKLEQWQRLVAHRQALLDKQKVKEDRERVLITFVIAVAVVAFIIWAQSQPAGNSSPRDPWDYDAPSYEESNGIPFRAP